jgi:hypothetical protein
MLSTPEVVELERKLLIYRLKKRMYYGAFVVIACCIGGGLYYVFPRASLLFNQYFADSVDSTKNTDLQTPASLVNTTTMSDSNVTSVVMPSLKEANATIKPQEALLLQLPTITASAETSKKSYMPPPEDFDTGIKEEAVSNRVATRKPSPSTENNFYRSKEEQIDTALLPPPLPDEEKPKGFIKIESHEINSITYLKEKFDSTHNIVFALMLAEEYYLNKNYNESNKWALIANNLDADNEKSWLWFAKSKVKLGHKEDAILALKTYIKNSKSQAAQSLLNQITLGEMIN